MDPGGHTHPKNGLLIEGRYRILRQIGEGGMASIHEVLDLRTDVRRAMKLVRPALRGDGSLGARLLSEARIVAKVRSEHVVPVTDVGIDSESGAAFFVMDLLEGESLSAMSRRRGALPAAEVVTMLHQVALAVDRAHAAGVVHLDLKPGNLFVVARDDGSPCVRVLDFGIARAALGGPAGARGGAAGEEAAGAPTGGGEPLAGTPAFMAPEQIAGGAEVGPASDLHALGHVAFALLAGEPYFEEEREVLGGRRRALLERIALGVGELPVARAERRRGVHLPDAYDGWMTRATAPRPADRFGSGADLVAGLAQALGVSVPRPPIVLEDAPPVDRGGDAAGETTETALTSGTSPPPIAPLWRRLAGRRGLAAAVAAGAILLVVVRGGLPSRSGGGAPDANGAESKVPVSAGAESKVPVSAGPGGAESGAAASGGSGPKDTGLAGGESRVPVSAGRDRTAGVSGGGELKVPVARATLRAGVGPRDVRPPPPRGAEEPLGTAAGAASPATVAADPRAPRTPRYEGIY